MRYTFKHFKTEEEITREKYYDYLRQCVYVWKAVSMSLKRRDMDVKEVWYMCFGEDET